MGLVFGIPNPKLVGTSWDRTPSIDDLLSLSQVQTSRSQRILSVRTRIHLTAPTGLFIIGRQF